MAIHRRNDSKDLKSNQRQVGDAKSFIRYSSVGAFVGFIALITMAVSEAIFSPTKLNYVFSVVGIYGVGVVLSYMLQKEITFHAPLKNNQKKTFFKYTAVALIGALLTSCFSYILRYHIHWPVKFLQVAGPACFAVACLATSVITFYLNKEWTFRTEVIPLKINRKSNES
jgi:putative flippase GtrA